MAAPLDPSSRQSKLAAVIRVSSGNFLEMYDFFVFAYYASAIGRAFFPLGSYAQRLGRPRRAHRLSGDEPAGGGCVVVLPPAGDRAVAGIRLFALQWRHHCLPDRDHAGIATDYGA